MRILTIGSSPYLLARSGKINYSILSYLKKKGHIVGSAIRFNDINWHLTDENGIVKFEINKENICDLYTFVDSPQISPDIYEIMKKFQPEIVITIGDYQENDFLFAIKMLHPKLFKWINILTIDAIPINDNRKKSFDYMDYVLTTTKSGLEEVKRLSNVPSEYIPFGIEDDFCKLEKEKTDKLFIFGCGKNSQTSNLASLIKGISKASKIEENISGYIHTNISDKGDYDLLLLKERYGVNIGFPEGFVGLNDGLGKQELNEKYNKSDIIVDASVRSATALSLLEGMSTGCIPVGTKIGAIKEVISLMSKEYQFFIESNMYVGQLEEEYEIIAPDSLSDTLLYLYELKKKDLEKFNKIKEESIVVASKFKINNFLTKIEDIVEKSKNIKVSFVVESFEKM
jgi:glycosyltransferase involved in cell wall biosynthesis